MVTPKVYKLAVLEFTIPSIYASVEHSFSVLKRIKLYCRSTEIQGGLSGLALTSIKKQTLIFKYQKTISKKLNGLARKVKFTYN
jgi:hypothetical protein